MALDSMQERMSAIHPGSPWRGPMVDAAEAGFTQGNKQAAVFLYSGIAAVSLTLRNMIATNLALDSTLSKGFLGFVGNTLPIEVTAFAPSVAPPSGKGVVFRVSNGIATIYVWDGFTWVSLMGELSGLAQVYEWDAGGNPIYHGMAEAGTPTSDALWRIRKFVYDGEDIVAIQWADGDSLFDNVWDDRAILSYS